MNVIEVIDTAVKVGLGALISGIATYSVTKLNHKSDRRKEAAQRTYDALVLVSDKLETYFHAFTQAISRLDGLIRHGVSPGELDPAYFKLYLEEDDKLVKSRRELFSAMTRLDLVGETGAANAVRALSPFENEFRQKVVFEKQLPSLQELEEYRESLIARRSKIFFELNAAYKRHQL